MRLQRVKTWLLKENHPFVSVPFIGDSLSLVAESKH